ncbi:hypothetical protein Tco_0215353 [Tanacetum coccineum]
MRQLCSAIRIIFGVIVKGPDNQLANSNKLDHEARSSFIELALRCDHGPKESGVKYFPSCDVGTVMALRSELVGNASQSYCLGPHTIALISCIYNDFKRLVPITGAMRNWRTVGYFFFTMFERLEYNLPELKGVFFFLKESVMGREILVKVFDKSSIESACPRKTSDSLTASLGEEL